LQKLKLIFLIFLLCSSLFADDIYFLPRQSKVVKNIILSNIQNAQNSIDIAMYNFKYKEFANALDNAAKRGIKVKVYYYKKKVNFTDKIIVFKVQNKFHVKIALFDNKTAIFGSANWTKDSFKKNYEVIYITKKEKIIKKISRFFSTIKI